MKYIRITIQLDPEQASALEAMAGRRDRSLSYLVRQAVADYLSRQEGLSVPVSLGKNTRRALRVAAEVSR
jgi:predicted transcriptional regulator